MKTVGLITEYNPFHNGHLYHLTQARRITDADYVIVVMSGNFVQRGAPALMDKYSRTRMALACGADIVLELPVSYSTASAEYFALGAVSLLERLGIVDYLCFGSESGNPSSLESAARDLMEEPPEYRELLSHLLKNGKTFPAARMEALKTISPLTGDSILSSPNNILGIEYIKAIQRLNSSIRPVTIKRLHADYHSAGLSSLGENAISSATAIRKTLLKEKFLTNLKNHVPEAVFEIMREAYGKTFPIYEEDYSLLLNYKIMLESKTSLAQYTDITTDLANRIYGLNTQGLNFPELARTIKTRQWTLTRINRCLTHLLLNLYSENFKTYNMAGYAQYARLLGFRKSASHLIRDIVNKDNIPVITKVSDAKKVLSGIGFTMLQEDIFAARLYNQVVYEKYGISVKDEYTHGVIIF